jgi:hypothetical protein
MDCLRWYSKQDCVLFSLTTDDLGSDFDGQGNSYQPAQAAVLENYLLVVVVAAAAEFVAALAAV